MTLGSLLEVRTEGVSLRLGSTRRLPGKGSVLSKHSLIGWSSLTGCYSQGPPPPVRDLSPCHPQPGSGECPKYSLAEMSRLF